MKSGTIKITEAYSTRHSFSLAVVATDKPIIKNSSEYARRVKNLLKGLTRLFPEEVFFVNSSISDSQSAWTAIKSSNGNKAHEWAPKVKNNTPTRLLMPNPSILCKISFKKGDSCNNIYAGGFNEGETRKIALLLMKEINPDSIKVYRRKI